MSGAIIVKITGDSGDGVQLVGERLTITAALSGKEVRTMPDFPAEIRAPAGTVAGVSGFQLAIAEKEIFTAGEHIDVLVAMNPAALKQSFEFLNQGSLILINEDSLTAKDFAKARVSESLLADARDNYQVISIPIITNTIKALEDVDISHAQAKKAKNFYILGVVLWLFSLTTKNCEDFIKVKFKDPNIAQANLKALKAGFNFALTMELTKREFSINKAPRAKGSYRQINGVEALTLAIATLASKTKTKAFVSGYPITPASNILHECAKLNNYGIELFQAEDEISAICACIGASFGGSLALCCTSGPGLDLKSESLGLACVMELPLVVIDVQRAGASTGLPTKTGQSDLNIALYGRHGETPIPVIAATSPADCYDTLLKAFTIAVKYMTPVILLMDAFLANGAELWQIPQLDTVETPKIKYNQNNKPYTRDENLSRSWNIPGTPSLMHQLGGLEKQGEDGKVSYDPKNHEQMISLRGQKIGNIANEIPVTQIEGIEESEILLIGWGSTYNSIREVREKLIEEGVAVAHIQLKHIKPLPKDLASVFIKYKYILVCELNTGHLCSLLRNKYLIDAKSVTQCNGQPFSQSLLLEKIKNFLKERVI